MADSDMMISPDEYAELLRKMQENEIGNRLAENSSENNAKPDDSDVILSPDEYEELLRKKREPDYHENNEDETNTECNDEVDSEIYFPDIPNYNNAGSILDYNELEIDEDDNTEKYQNILVTGFAPFGKYRVNASWEGVQLLQGRVIHNQYRIVAKQVPVVYEYIDEHVPKMWDDLKPVLVVHVGVSHLTDKFTLETTACRSGYIQQDTAGKIQVESRFGNEDEAKASIDIHKICEEFNQNSFEKCLESGVSCDAGRYLCEYIYYTSLSIDCKRTLFIHVPPILEKPYTAEQLAQGIFSIINLALNHVPKEFIR